LINAAACIGTAIVLFPVVKRQSEALALGFVAARTVEAALVVVNVVAYLAVVTLRQPEATGPDADRWPPLAARSSRSTTGPSCSAKAPSRASTRCCSVT
jgi:hypothetical protein